MAVILVGDLSSSSNPSASLLGRPRDAMAERRAAHSACAPLAPTLAARTPPRRARARMRRTAQMGPGWLWAREQPVDTGARPGCPDRRSGPSPRTAVAPRAPLMLMLALWDAPHLLAPRIPPQRSPVRGDRPSEG